VLSELAEHPICQLIHIRFVRLWLCLSARSRLRGTGRRFLLDGTPDLDGACLRPG